MKVALRVPVLPSVTLASLTDNSGGAGGGGSTTAQLQSSAVMHGYLGSAVSIMANGAQVMNVNVLKELARHGKVEMTLRYTHTAKAEAAEAVNQLPQLRGEPARRRNRPMEPVLPDQKSDQTVVASRDLMSAFSVGGLRH